MTSKSSLSAVTARANLREVQINEWPRYMPGEAGVNCRRAEWSRRGDVTSAMAVADLLVNGLTHETAEAVRVRAMSEAVGCDRGELLPRFTVAQAYDYCEHADEFEGESKGDWGMGAVSLGYDPAEWVYDGYRTSEDPVYQYARAIVGRCEDAEAELVARDARRAERVTHQFDDDLPF